MTADGEALFMQVAVFISILLMVPLKRVHGFVLPRRERLVQKYVEVAGRITALLQGQYLWK